MDSDKWTDTELERLEKRIAEQYEQAQKELGEKAQAYFLQFEDRFKREELAMLTTSLTKDEVETKWVDLYGSNAGFERWYKGADHAYGQTKTEAENKFKLWEMAQLGRGQHWYDMRDQMAQRLTETNKIAEGYINNTLPSIYVANNNGVADIAKASAMDKGITGIRFDMVDENTVRNLMMESSSVRPYKPVNISLDESNSWSKNKLQNALLQGILQGDSIDHIADRFQAVTNMNRAAAVRNARTACTYAQSKGKQDRFESLAEQGCVFTKIWKATNDDRTREEHWDADGQEVDFDQAFEVGGELLMEPGDPTASGWNRYNCRCTMRTGKIKFTSTLTSQKSESANIRIVDTIVQGEKYQASLNEILKSNVGEFNLDKTFDTIDQQYVKNINDRFEKCDNKDVGRAWNEIGKMLSVAEDNAIEVCFSPSSGLHLNVDEDKHGGLGYLPFQATAEEIGHGIDYVLGQQGLYSLEYKNGKFYETVQKEITNYMNDIRDKFGNDENKDELLVDYINNLVKNDDFSYGLISDLVDGMLGGGTRLILKHSEDYYRDNPELMATETFSGFFSAEATNKLALVTLKKAMPESYNMYRSMLKEGVDGYERIYRGR